MNNFRNRAILLLIGVAGFYACEERERFGISSDDTISPSPPVFDSVQALPGGARIFYQIPADEDVISIEASFMATNGKLIKSAVSFFAPYLEVFGLPDTLEHTLQLYALDRAGNQSTVVPVRVKPEEPAYSRVAKSLDVYPAFGAILFSWKNEGTGKKDVNVYVDFSYSDNGKQRSIRQVFSSNKEVDRQFIKDLNLSASEPVSVQVSVEDLYGNLTKSRDTVIYLKTDALISKDKWELPDPGVAIGGVYMSNGNYMEGQNRFIIDGNINDEFHPRDFGIFETVYNVDGADRNHPLNFMIDLGAKYQLSRIVTHQRRFWNPTTLVSDPRGDLYGYRNVGIYKMYYWDGDDDPINNDDGIDHWVEISPIKIPMPDAAATVLEIVRMGTLGDESLMYPDQPDFTPPTRWFRYQAVAPFTNNYGGPLSDIHSLSEITLYGRQAP
ncbi:hypothetical protein SAMD00024442_45_3 [Candidatus Symbiothrix dinenymphae]|nr:hypothetical protein SAMD00024442_45_3 [Candidatus Symbiothrix dinenymphae]